MRNEASSFCSANHYKISKKLSKGQMHATSSGKDTHGRVTAKTDDRPHPFTSNDPTEESLVSDTYIKKIMITEPTLPIPTAPALTAYDYGKRAAASIIVCVRSRVFIFGFFV